jgi:hypothetical protein
MGLFLRRYQPDQVRGFYNMQSQPVGRQAPRSVWGGSLPRYDKLWVIAGFVRVLESLGLDVCQNYLKIFHKYSV